jgi:hypothetical protein
MLVSLFDPARDGKDLVSFNIQATTTYSGSQREGADRLRRMRTHHGRARSPESLSE